MSETLRTSDVPRRVWARAALRRDEELAVERSTGWLELFFDLVFVVIIARLASALAYYSERFESEGLDSRVFTFLALLPVWPSGPRTGSGPTTSASPLRT